MSPAAVRAWWRRHANGLLALGVLDELHGIYDELHGARPSWPRRLWLRHRARRLWARHRHHMAAAMAAPEE